MSTTKLNQAVLGKALLEVNRLTDGDYAVWLQNVGQLIFYIISQNNSQFSPTDTGLFTDALERLSADASSEIDDKKLFGSEFAKSGFSDLGKTAMLPPDDVAVTTHVALDNHDLAVLYKIFTDIDPFDKRDKELTFIISLLAGFVLWNGNRNYRDPLWSYFYNKRECLLYPTEADSSYGEYTWADVQYDYDEARAFIGNNYQDANFHILSGGAV